MKNSTKINFDGDIAYIEIARPDLGENMTECREVMTKELFIACYERWIKKAEPTEKTGEWIDNPNLDGWSCSNCGGFITSRYGKSSYCPNCGARMI